MPRQPSAEIALRNRQIYSEWKEGRSLAWLAEKYDRTPQQMGRVVAGFHPELEDDDARAIHRGRLEALYEEVSAVAADPGWKLTASGKVALDDNDEPVIDINARIEALKLKLMVLESERKLDARDRPQQKQLQITHELATSQAAIDIARRRAEMEAMARRAGQSAVQGEVLRELPPAAEG